MGIVVGWEETGFGGLLITSSMTILLKRFFCFICTNIGFIMNVESYNWFNKLQYHTQEMLKKKCTE